MTHHTGTHAAAFAAYGKSQKTNASADPRATEARALRIAARELKQAADDGGLDAMHDALQHNAQLWILIADAVTADDSPLDPARRADVAKLAAWVVDRTLACMATRDPSIAEHLCGLNTTLARGLDGMPATEDEMKAAEAALAARAAADRAAADRAAASASAGGASA